MTGAGLGTNIAAFVAASAVVWFAGTRLTRFVDELAERKQLNRALMGAFVLATVTQLPELVTNLTAAFRGDARLALNGMFGGVSMQTAVLVIADAVTLRYAISHLSRRPSNLVLAAALISLLSVVLAFCVAGDTRLIGHVGAAPVVFAAGYGFIIWLASRVEEDTTWVVAVAPEDGDDHVVIHKRRASSMTTTQLVLGSIAASAVILGAGIALVLSAESLADQTGLGSSFIGVTLLASATSLPEVSTTLTAVRLGQHSMALADIFGSNLIMVGLLLPTDIFFREGLLLARADESAVFALALGILLTSVYLVGLLLRRPGKWMGLGHDSWIALLVYAAGLAILYQLR